MVVLIEAPTARTRNFMAADPSFSPCRQISSGRKRAASISSYTFGNKCASILRWSRARELASPLYQSIICSTASPNKFASGTNWRNTCRTSINGRLFRGDNAEDSPLRIDLCWPGIFLRAFFSKALSNYSIAFVSRYSLEIDYREIIFNINSRRHYFYK